MTQGYRLHWKVIDDILIACSTAGEVPQELWKDLIADVRKHRVTKVIGLSLGQSSISSSQRKEVSELARLQGIRLVNITDDKLVRGIMTALSWLGVNVIAFPMSQLREGIASLKLPLPLQERVYTEAVELRRLTERP
ncbi:MAG TPA: hypothetical protein VH877_24955 [Polyangia bacterium]|jgi:hypothetical protein|nr:hypothetical protein [Polyangia bacterium]